MPIYELDGQAPDLPEEYWIAETAVVIGRVRLGVAASVWFGSVLRGDNEWVEIGANANIQENCTLHTDIGFALTVAQFGGKHESAKPWKGLGSGVMEIVSDYDTNTYRAIYTVNIGDVIYVLHAFQKKSKKGIATPQPDIDLIWRRLAEAERDYEERQKRS